MTFELNEIEETAIDRIIDRLLTIAHDNDQEFVRRLEACELLIQHEMHWHDPTDIILDEIISAYADVRYDNDCWEDLSHLTPREIVERLSS